MPEFTLEPVPEVHDCHVEAKSKSARRTVHFASADDVEATASGGWAGTTLCGRRGALTDVGAASGPRCQRCVQAKDSAARNRRISR